MQDGATDGGDRDSMAIFLPANASEFAPRVTRVHLALSGIRR